MAKNPAWKKAERRFASLFGTQRRPLSGSNSRSGGTDDGMHERLYLENKYRRNHAIWTLYRETRDKAQQEGRIPVIGLQEKNAKGILVVMHSDDFKDVVDELIKVRSSDSSQ